MRHFLAAFALALGTMTSSIAQVNVSIGINVPVYPQLVRVPGYPVYYAPQLDSNYFFYDGMYWVYSDDNWYASTWYNGPWELIAPDFVPLFILRVPVRYYRRAPVYFRDWRRDAPPRWGDHWGNTWYTRHRGWDSWNRSAVPAPAPLPVYQRQYSGNRYPRAEQQVTLQTRNYRYSPRDATVRRQYETRQAALPAGAAPPATTRTPSQTRQNVPRPPDSSQPRPPRNDMRAQPAPSARPPQPQARDAGAQPAGAPPMRTQTARPPSGRPAEQSVAPAPRPQNADRAARPPSNQRPDNAGNAEHRGNAGNAQQRGNAGNAEQRGNGPDNAQRGNEQRGRGGPPGQEKKND